MDSNRSFPVMVKFIEIVKTPELKVKLENVLSKPKSFRNFKYIIDESEYRQAWFDFRLSENMDWVKEQIDEK